MNPAAKYLLRRLKETATTLLNALNPSNKKLDKKLLATTCFAVSCFLKYTYVNSTDVDGLSQAVIISSVGNSGEIGRRGEH